MAQAKILIVSATELEIKDIQQDLIHAGCSILVTGIGTHASCYTLTKYLQHNPCDYIINVGIAGAYSTDLQIGEVIQVATDQFADLGIESPTEFTPLYRTSLPFPFASICSDGLFNLTNHEALNHLKTVRAITCDTAHGSKPSIDRYKALFSPEIETMEGAAVAMTTLLEKKPVIALRAISNYVEPRDFSKWNIPLALQNLHHETIALIKKMRTKQKA